MNAEPDDVVVVDRKELEHISDVLDLVLTDRGLTFEEGIKFIRDSIQRLRLMAKKDRGG